MKFYIILLIPAILSACSHHEVIPTQPVVIKAPRETVAEIINSSRTERYSETLALDVFYVTNRETGSDTNLCNNQSFGVRVAQQKSYGLCRVNVPKRHATGQIEIAPDSRADTHRFFRVLNQKTFDSDSFLKNILSHPSKEVLVFIHGFNVKFQDAVFRASQIAYDLKFQGPVILFSWPAGAESGFLNKAMISRTYENNKQNAEQSIPSAIDFFKTLAQSGLNINVIIHSMGHQITLPALNAIAKDPGINLKIDELVLNAPDYDLKDFKNIASDLKKVANRITLYCSYNDNAMAASETYNGGARLGVCEKIDGVDVINVSDVDSSSLSSGLGHSYYSSRAVLTDVAQLMMGIEAEKRLFIRKSEPNSTEDYYLRP